MFVLREFEIIVFFFALLDLPPFRTEFARFVPIFVGQKLFLANAVETNLLIFINFPLVEKTLQHSLHTCLVQRIDRRRPGIITHIKFVPKRDELFGDSRDKLLRRHALALG